MNVIAAALDNLEEERRHHEIQASSLRTDLEYVTRERDDFLEQIIALRQTADWYKSQECMKLQNEIVARAETAERERDELRARLAAERERCAKIAEAHSNPTGYDPIGTSAKAIKIAAAIRAEETK